VTTGLFQWRYLMRVSFVERKFEIYVIYAIDKTSVAAVAVEVPKQQYCLDVCRWSLQSVGECLSCREGRCLSK
jgi:hypothetical protein